MSVSSLSTAILAHMRAVRSVPPPAPRGVPGLKMSELINYGQLEALCHMRELQCSWSALNILSVHNKFMKQYPKIFLQKKTRLPKLAKQEEKRKPPEDSEEIQPQPPDDESHNIAVYVKRARGGRTRYGAKQFEEKLEELLAILKKMPIRRTPREHNTVWRMLRTVPGLTSQVTDDHLRTLSRNAVSETWVKGSTVVGNDGLYVILKGQARPRTWADEDLSEENASTACLTTQSFHSFVFSDDADTPLGDPTLRQWSTFGTLEVSAQTQSESNEYSVVAEEDCEILKIPARNYAKLRLEKTRLGNKQTVELIRKCPYYKEWPTLSINELVLRVNWKKFPRGHVIVESGAIISFVAYINSGHCNIYRNVVGLVKLQSRKVKKVLRRVYMGKLGKHESFGEISVLLQVPFTCTVIAGEEVEMAVIDEKDLFELDPVTQQLMIQTAKPTFGHLTDEDVRNAYLQKEMQKEWNDFKDKTVKNSLYYNGIIPGFGKWNHHWTSVPRNLKETSVSY